MDRARVRSNQLFKLTKSRVKDAEQAFELLQQLDELSRMYVALGNPNDPFWLDFSSSRSVRACVEEINLFRTKQAYPALFAAYKHFNEQRFGSPGISMLK